MHMKRNVILLLTVILTITALIGCQPHPNNPGQTDEEHETGQTDTEAGNQTAIDTANTFQYVRAIGNTVYYLKTSFVDGNMWNQDHGNTVYKWDGNEATVFYVHDKEILALNECEGYLIIDEEGGERHIIKVE